MSRAAKKTAPVTWRHALVAPTALVRPRTTAGRAFLAIVAGLAIAFGLPALWRSVRSYVAAQPEYLVDLSEVTITPLPPWIRADVKSEAIRDAGLDPQLSILDDRTVDRITQAFALHPWVAKVMRVERGYPAAIHADLIYREPVAMVEVTGGLLPVDAEGTLLPPADFTPADTAKYLWISSIPSSPRGPAGTRWGDPAVEGAAALALALNRAPPELGLARIRPRATSTARPTDPPPFEILTRNRAVFVWGSPPGQESPGEPKAAQKLARLKRLFESGLEQVSLADRDLTTPQRQDGPIP